MQLIIGFGYVLLTCLLFIMPGWVLCKSLGLFDETREPATWQSFIVAIGFAGLCVTGLLSVLLLELGLFSLISLFIVVTIACLVMAFIGRKRLLSRHRFQRPGLWETVLFVGILLLALCLFPHPMRDITSGHDVGVYINSAVAYADNGSISYSDKLIKGMSLKLQEKVFGYQAQGELAQRRMMRFPDFAIVDAGKGMVAPIQPPLHQAILAVFYLMFGLNGIFFAHIMMGFLALLAVYLVCLKIMPPYASGIVAALLATNYAQIFFVQYTSPEILFQGLLFFGLYAFLELNNERSSQGWAIISAIALGVLLLVRVDAVLILFALVILEIWAAFKHKLERKHYIFSIIYILIMAYGAAHIAVFNGSYIQSQIIAFNFTYGINSELIMVGAALGLIGLFVGLNILARYFRQGNLSRTASKVSSGHQALVARVFVAFTATAIVVYLIALPLTPRGYFGQNLLSLSWYIDGFLLVIAAAGGFMALREKNRNVLTILLFITPFALFYLAALSNTPIYPWAMRRYITVVVPAIFIFGMLFMARLPLRNSFKSYLVIGMSLVLLVESVSVSKTMTLNQYESVPASVSKINYRLRSDIYLEVSSNRQGEAISEVYLATPLSFIYSKQIIYLWRYPSRETLREMVTYFNRKGLTVGLISGGKINGSTLKEDFSPDLAIEQDGVEVMDYLALRWLFTKPSYRPAHRTESIYFYSLRIKDGT